MKKDFYEFVVEAAGIRKDESVVVLCGGPYDRQVFLSAGLHDVVISNLEHHDHVVSEYEPFQWMRQDAEQMTLADDSFDWAVVHAGLHHCGSPHKAMCEMLRVARRGILVIESRDSVLVRLAAWLGLSLNYELAPAALSLDAPGGAFGGLRGSFIPNYVYRWKEREVEKTVKTYLPQYEHTFRFFYALKLPVQHMTMSKNALARFAVNVLDPLTWVFERVVPRQGNLFGFVVTKRDSVMPWLTEDQQGLRINKEYFLQRYSPEKYGKKVPAEA